ncbi:MAG: 4-alpha-glucanotransferase [Candidatus Omnitrophica bacterium]|nr:4-alpha-glucanotransferase [Candidatus Omnitrophota bacterium]
MKKGSGVLEHITSLPSEYGIGDLGPHAYEFVDFLQQSGQKYWQILPLNPTSDVFSNSPYSSCSAFGLNTLLISPDSMIGRGWLKKKELEEPRFSTDHVDFPSVRAYKQKMFKIAYQRFCSNSGGTSKDFVKFCQENSYWLDDFALFVVLKEMVGDQLWNTWPVEIRDRDPRIIRDLTQKYASKIEEVKFLQFVFFHQWMDLKKYCNQKGISIIGDIPIYVGEDSADVWTYPQYYKLDENKRLKYVAGVPPDYFSKTGQRWGNPVYDWDHLKQDGFKWWLDRIKYNLKLFDVVRIDHFRGLVGYWQIPASEETAINGQWIPVPAQEFFTAVKEHFPHLPIIAEDLGVITDDVVAMMEQFGFPGMKILVFAFNGDMENHPYLPHNYTRQCVVYTGTHDNNTVLGWFQKEASLQEKMNVFEYIGKRVPRKEINWALIKLALESSAQIALFPLQDILSLDQKARMNVPATITGNWIWRAEKGMLTRQIAERLRQLTVKAKR